MMQSCKADVMTRETCDKVTDVAEVIGDMKKNGD